MAGAPGDRPGLGCAERGGDAAGEAVCGGEQQGEESTDVQYPENGGLEPPGADRACPCERSERDTGGEGSQAPRQQRSARREKLGRLRGMWSPTPSALALSSSPSPLGLTDRCFADTVPARRSITLRDLLTFTWGFGMQGAMFAAPEPWPIVTRNA